ncbi:MAG TPA: hypothetical protein RMH99_30350 [Sandaracinaceae bacterium LLY-WYZ-13_1]|nr:hypothetical protein [Sandaracinaceae bacterium LLY-WYZ-13_1]
MSSTDRLVRRASIPIALAALLGGCVGSIDDAEPFFAAAASGTCTADDAPSILASSCGGEGCHGPSESAVGLDLVSSGLAGRLVGVSGSADGECNDHVLIDPDDPAASLLSAKTSTAPPCGSRMPLAGAFLSRAEQACLEDWVRMQAMAGGPDGGT